MKRKICSLAIGIILTASLLTGCGKGNDVDALDFSNATLSGMITAVEDNKVTISLTGGMGGGRMMDGRQNGEMPTGEDGQTPPELPTSEDGQTPPELPTNEDGQSFSELPANEDNQESSELLSGEDNAASSNASSGESTDKRPEGSSGKQNGSGMANTFGGRFSQGNSTFTLTITDESLLSECTMSDITEGSFITITFGDDNTISSISVMKLTNMEDNSASPEQNGSTEETGTSANTITEDSEESNISYSSDINDENALRVEGIIHYSGSNLTIDKSGTTSNTESSDFYGLNAGFLTLNGGSSILTDSTITTNGQGANGIFAYGSGSNVTVSNTTITTSADNSGGIDVTGGASIQASNLTIETNGNSSAAIRSDRGGGTLNVSGGTYTTNGTGSPTVYCTADITVSDATLTATASEGVVIEGKNSVTLENCDITGNMQGTYHGDENENLHTIMIYQSMSGDADEGKGTFTMNGGSITGQNGDLIYSTNTTSELNLNNVKLTLSNDTLLRVCGNDGSRGWGTAGSNGSDMSLFTTNQQLTGNIIVDDISSLILTLSEASNFEGAINPEQDGGTVNVSLDNNSTWKLTADSYITSFEGSLDNIDSNGFTLYINGVAQSIGE